MVGQILLWWVVVELVGLLALPLTMTLFRRLPDQGYSFAKPLGILMISYLAWLVAMLGLSSFSRFVLIVACLIVGALGLLGAVRVHLAWREIVRRIWPAIALHEAVFALGLVLGLYLRWRGIYGVQINHTEAPMDFALLNGILASHQFPPQDPWMSQYPINYYYFGYVMIAALTRLSGMSSAITFTLAGATIYALVATGVVGIVWNLISIERSAPSISRTSRKRGWATGACALLAATLVVVAGNQVAALEWITQSEAVVVLRGAEVLQALGQVGSDAPISLQPPLPPMPWESSWSGLSTLPRAESRSAAVSNWWPSRAVWDDLRDSNGQIYRTYTITEFPFFSFLLGDLHPHVLALPWTLLAIVLALNVFLRPSAPEWLRGSVGRIELLITAVALGGLYAINSWDLPTYLLLYLGVLFLLYVRLAPEPEPGRRQIVWPHFIQQALTLLVASWLAWLPFHLTFTSLVGGNGSPLGLSPVHTPLTQFIVVFGLFAVPLLAWMLFESRGPGFSRFSARSVAVVIGIGLIVVGITIHFALLFLLPLAIWAAILAYRNVEHPARSFALAIIALGSAIVVGTDIVYLRDVFEGQTPRMNTLFKFYYQVWLLWGLLTGYVVFMLLRRFRWHTLGWLLPTGLLLVGALVYPALEFVVPTLAANGNPGDYTLDGTAYIARDRPGDAAGIAWIEANVPTNAIVLQAPLEGGYQPQYASIATVTGRPTVIGWSGHENQWRGGQASVLADVGQRVADATAIYTTPNPDEARSLIEKYDVAYVYVGPVEQQFVAEKGAPALALTKFPQFMDVVWSGEGATIYRRR